MNKECDAHGEERQELAQCLSRRTRRMVKYSNSLLCSEDVPWNQNSIDLRSNQDNPICVKMKDQCVCSLGLHSTKQFI